MWNGSVQIGFNAAHYNGVAYMKVSGEQQRPAEELTRSLRQVEGSSERQRKRNELKQSKLESSKLFIFDTTHWGGLVHAHVICNRKLRKLEEF